MEIIKAKKRTTISGGQINKLRQEGFIPAILYGGKKNNISLSLNKLHIKDIIKTETFMSKVVDMDIEGNTEKVIPREIAYDPLSDEPIHIDFMRIVKGSRLILEIPVKFTNIDKSPGLKMGGVLNTVRRKVELKCPAENIPNEIIIDLSNAEIGRSIKISSIQLPQNVVPTITDRDFVIATVVSPTVVVEPEKTEETTAEGDVPAEETAEGVPPEEDKDKSVKASDGKEKPAEDKTKSAAGEKGKSANKETKKK
jgi:large subunit ribosomal protein L25